MTQKRLLRARLLLHYVRLHYDPHDPYQRLHHVLFRRAHHDHVQLRVCAHRGRHDHHGPLLDDPLLDEHQVRHSAHQVPQQISFRVHARHDLMFEQSLVPK